MGLTRAGGELENKRCPSTLRASAITVAPVGPTRSTPRCRLPLPRSASAIAAAPMLLLPSTRVVSTAEERKK